MRQNIVLRLALLLAALLLLGIGTSTSSDAPQTATELVTDQDGEHVLVAAAKAFVTRLARGSHLPEDFCAADFVGLSDTMELRGPVVDGWHITGNPDPSAIRQVLGPNLDRLPDQVRVAFDNRPPDCHHAIHFHNPVFLETHSPRGKALMAIVSLSDLCPLCGEGYEIQFRKVGNTWQVEPPGLYATWLS